MKAKYLLPAIAIILLALVLIKLYTHKNDASSTTSTAAPIVPVEFFILKDTLISFPVRTMGSIRSNEVVDIVGEISRRVTGIGFKEGSLVSKGTVLFTLDDTELQAELRKVESRLTLARETEKRNRQLYGSGGVTLQQLDESRVNREELEAEIDYLNAQIGKTKIRAPFSGKTGLRQVSEGALVSPGAVLTRLEDISRLKLDFTVPEKYAPVVRPGMQLSFTAEGCTGSFTATVEATETSVNTGNANLLVRAVIGKEGKDLIPGLSADVSLKLDKSGQGRYVPTVALIPTTKGYAVYRIHNNQVERVPVKEGLRSASMVEILEGLQPGDTVAATNLMKLKPGSAVKPLNPFRP